jgi:hypothetical protein
MTNLNIVLEILKAVSCPQPKSSFFSFFYYYYFFYSHVHTLFGSFLPPAPYGPIILLLGIFRMKSVCKRGIPMSTAELFKIAKI